MKGYWHLLMLAMVVAILATSFDIIYFCFIYLIWLYILFRKKRIKLLHVVASMLFILIGLLYFSNVSNSINNLDVTQPHSYFGKITSEISNTSAKTTFTFQDTKSDNNILITFFKGTNGVDNKLTSAKTGATCVINGKVEMPPQSKNPGQFDYHNYLIKQNINYQLSIEKPEDVLCTGESPLHSIYQLRENTLARTEKTLNSFTNQWLQALLLGETNNFSGEIKELFQRWNLSHLLAISGLHVGLLVSCCYFLFVKAQLLTREKARFLLLIFLLIYPLLSGGAPSVWRASMMTFLGFIILTRNIKLPLTDIISVVFLTFIIFNKMYVYQLGFQFSFIVTIAILLSKRIITLDGSKALSLLKISFISLMSLLPFQIYNFFFFNPLSIVINLFFVPYFTLFVIPYMLLLMVIILVFPFLSPTFEYVFEVIHRTVLSILETLDSVVYFPWITGRFPLQIFIPYYVILFIFMGYLIKKKSKQAFTYGCLLVVLLLFVSIQPYLNPKGTVTMLDVGQGDSTVIELPYRRGVIIIDAAGSVENDFQTPSDKIYNQVIKPYLYSRGISTIDALVFSHEDHDHIGSASFLLDDFKVKQIISSEYFVFSNDLTQKISSNNIEILKMKSGNKLTVSDHVFHVVSPDKVYGSTNANSLVLLTELGGLTWLYTGDIDNEVEKSLIDLYPNMKFDILKVAHHGSSSSTSSEFLEVTNPKIALISVGENNRYGHPSKDVLHRLIEHNIDIYRTDGKGAIQYIFLDKKGTFQTKLP
ncbi:DNA internalization-related competence protein ComEC/Rec2 [Aquibacillus rhizosphaerae]|uniref:DNA internalization-related competence protein ComEC/Rec2 n=1 Tax=Aquibacillus rhizosphaerae TaxID=3051431 RepID=A0ABT7L6L3_9BACI|nr:DNA internalization-related competence protein ComEC/Rec2 [Aquibacillus sp. LR5S19]MDL4841479.1 DNA internalization-related competence protein ComEC/Rec2 [Aquibacillus sp. LR5S19]